MKIKYGIDLGTTNSSIARIDRGDTRILKTDTQKDTMPSCVAFDKRGTVRVGDTALNKLKSDRLRAMRTWTEEESNNFIEFKRAMGTDKLYESKNADAKFTADQLSAEIIKALRSLASEDRIESVVVTVPAKFTINQIDATRRAATLAGVKQVELLQEPVAASMAFGLNADSKDGTWLVFDFGGGTFDTALIAVVDGIMKVVDTEGNNHLGGSNLDYAIVDRIIIPYLEKMYAIDAILADAEKRRILRDAMKQYAEEAKIQLSFNDTSNILSDLGDIPGHDDEGEEFELDILVDQTMMKHVVGPIFQQAIDLCEEMLERQDLKGSDLTTLLLVGGPTYSPVLREMLKEQITEKVDASVDAMTVVAKGAALYASTVDVAADVREESRDKTKVQLQLSYEATSVETDELVTVKLLPGKTAGNVPDQLMVELSRGDKEWSSGKVKIDEVGDVIEVLLREGQANQFEVRLFDGQGNRVDVEPSDFTIIQGTQVGSATMPYHFGIEVFDRIRGRLGFVPVVGLEKNKSLPAKGVITGLKTSMDVRPGNESDSIKIPLYQGEHNSEGTRALYNEHVYDLEWTGRDFSVLIPRDTEVELTVAISRDQDVTCRMFLPLIEFEEEMKVPKNTVQKGVTAAELDGAIEKAKRSLEILREEGFSEETEAMAQLSTRLDNLESELGDGRSDYDRRMQVLGNLRKVLRQLDRVEDESEWPKTEAELKEALYELEENQRKFGDALKEGLVDQMRAQVEEVAGTKDKNNASKLIEEMRSMNYGLISQQVGFWLGFLGHLHENADSLSWTDRRRAYELMQQGVQAANQNPSVSVVRPIVQELLSLLPSAERLRAEAGGTVSR